MRPFVFLVLGFAVVAGCGNAFTQATGGGDGDSGTATDGATATDAGPDADTDDDASADASDADSGSDSATVADGSGMSDATGGCSNNPCPTGFECTLGTCVDRAAVHFSATANPTGNWTYGSAPNPGTAPVVYTMVAATDPTLEVWSTIAGSLTPSVFHNTSATSTLYSQGFTLAGSALGFAPSPPVAGEPGPLSIVRFTAPVTRNYAIFATFSGLVPSGGTTVSVSVLINYASGAASGGYLNAYSGGNTFNYSTASTMLQAGATVDFMVQSVATAMWMTGYTGLDARITAL